MKLLDHIVEASKQNDDELKKPKGRRLGYMGHLTIMSNDVIKVQQRPWLQAHTEAIDTLCANHRLASATRTRSGV